MRDVCDERAASWSTQLSSSASFVEADVCIYVCKRAAEEREREKRAEMLCVTWLLYQRVMAENSRVNSPVVLNYTRSCARASERAARVLQKKSRKLRGFSQTSHYLTPRRIY